MLTKLEAIAFSVVYSVVEQQVETWADFTNRLPAHEVRMRVAGASCCTWDDDRRRHVTAGG